MSLSCLSIHSACQCHCFACKLLTVLGCHRVLRRAGMLMKNLAPHADSGADVDESDASEVKALAFFRHYRPIWRLANKMSHSLHAQGEQRDWQEPCRICGRLYYHEHIRSVSKGNVVAGDADDL